MDGFLRTASYILAGLCILLIAAGITALIQFRKSGELDPAKLREFVLSSEEKAWLKQMREKPPEPPADKHGDSGHKAEPANGGISEDELLSRIAERINADRATQVIEELRRRRLVLDERQAYLEQQNAELALAKGDLERLRRQLDASRQDLEDERKRLDEERATWAAAQVRNTSAVQVMGEAEQARYAQQARLYEQMKDSAWQSLKRFEPKEIAKYLSLMEQKKAARMLALAEADTSLPSGFTTKLHRELLNLDKSGVTPQQVQRLATLYGFMKGADVAGYLKDQGPEEVADILMAMGESAVKKRAEILEALRAVDADKAVEVQRQLLKRNPTAKGS